MHAIDHTFKALVNEAGLPIHRQLVSKTGKENLLAIDASTLAKWYWLLATLNLDYSYTVNRYTFKRSRQLSGMLQKPSLRSLQAPDFTFQGKDDKLCLQTNVAWPLHLITPNATSTQKFDSTFFFSEGDLYGNFLLCTHASTQSNFCKLQATYNCNFLGRSVPFFLYFKNAKYTGTVVNISIQAEFYTIASD